jgi:predicted Zn finger-like uncharacterized protein
MTMTVACPECRSKLRLPDGLSGQEVRCPRCGTSFAAPDLPPPPPAEALQEPPLLLADETTAPSPEDHAFGLDLSLGDKASAASRPLPQPRDDSESAPRPPRRPMLNDDHDDLRDCPNCGKHVHRDYVRCPSCGERLSRSAGRRRANLGRRDAEPHRGGLVLTLGIISLVCAVVCWPIGPVLGTVTWVLGRIDLNKMKNGDMDTEGQANTQAGWICGIIATCIGLLFYLGCGTFWTFSLMAGPRGGVW